jgi:hypothetical protein
VQALSSAQCICKARHIQTFHGLIQHPSRCSRQRHSKSSCSQIQHARNGYHSQHRLTACPLRCEREKHSLGFALFALKDVKAGEEVVLAWEWMIIMLFINFRHSWSVHICFREFGAFFSFVWVPLLRWCSYIFRQSLASSQV